MLRILVIALVLLVGAMLLLPRARDAALPTETATVVNAPLPLPSFSLTDTAGRPFGNGDLRGGYHLLFFGFTHCPDICPLTLEVLRSVRERVAAQAPELEPLVTTLGVTVHKTEIDGQHYNVVHNGTIYVVGPKAGLVAVFGGSDHDAGMVAADYLRIRGVEPAKAVP